MSVIPPGAAFVDIGILPPVPKLDNTFGAVLLGTCFGLILYGLTSHQTYRYFRLYPNDVPIIKALVIVLMSLETFHTALCIHMCYYYLTTNYFNPLALLSGVWSLRLLPVVTGTVIFVCHGFYARRVYLIGGLYRPLVVVIAGFMLGELAFVIAATTESFVQATFAAWERYTWLISAGFGCAVGADLVLTTSLILVLHRSRTGFKSTDSMIDILIIYTINTGLLTGIFSLLSLIFAVVEPSNLIYVALNMVSTRSYANSVLAVLNSRRSLVERRFAQLDAGTFGMSALDSDTKRPGGSDAFQLPQLPPKMIDIKVDTENVQHRDTASENQDTSSLDDALGHKETV
ncbi:hypothetical protein GY45DRAFT_1375029 [Cubamyces sp. BRFM 1775]|nr:hypothetical protein GY45DRAFT_1375029 [Cubamyces sp. BRFM 1775]